MAASSLDDLKKVMLALPRMPKAIVDDTRHEKVLSYASAFISQSSPELYQTMLDQWHILSVLQECTAPGQDHRVSGVAMRILGVLLEHDPTRNGDGAVWHQLETRYPSLLDYLIQSNADDEALMRYSSWSALQHIVRYAKGAQWIQNTGRCPSMVRSAFKDTSNFVIVETCHFLVALINNSQPESFTSPLSTTFPGEEMMFSSGEETPHVSLLRSLLAQVPLCRLIHEMVSNQASEYDRLNGLEFLWMVTAARSPQSLAFLKQSRLLHDITTLLMDDSRLVRARALDVLAILLDTASDPLALIICQDDSATTTVTTITTATPATATTQNPQSADNDQQQPLTTCTDYLLDHIVLPLLLQPHYLKAWHVAVGILDAMVQPLCRVSDPTLRRSSLATILSTLLWILQACQDATTTTTVSTNGSGDGATIITIEGNPQCRLVQELNAKRYLHQEMRDAQRDKKRGDGRRRGGSEARVLTKTVVLSALKGVQKVARQSPESVEQSSLALERVLSILFNDALCADQRVFKTCLGTLPILLKAKVRDGQLLDRVLFSKTMSAILDLIRRQEGSSTPLKLILEAVQEFFADPGLGRVLVHEEIGQQLAQRLQAKLYDMEWDVRDTVVEFIGSLFADKGSVQEEGEEEEDDDEETYPATTASLQAQQQRRQPRHGVAWALKYNLLESVFQKLTDEESYVRAASVHSLELVMRNRFGWAAMSDPAVRMEERLSAQLPELIRDSEAFVRRAVVDAMICLVKEREAGTVLLVNGTDLFIDAKFMSRLALDDADWEVRMRACRFLAAVWDHSRLLNAQDDPDSRRASRIAKRAKGTTTATAETKMTSNWWFYDIRGDEILIEATRDEARMVRAESIALVKMIKRQIEQATPPEELSAFLSGAGEQGTDGAASTSSGHHHQEPSSTSRKRGPADKVDDGIHVNSAEDEESHHHHHHQKQRHQHPHAAFYRALCALDFVRLDATASFEQLYEEVLNVERVEDVVMEESEQPNDGNNVLDCY
ncbi:hypothetical protein DFQ26_002008 [Actinomortierella ambigua]|nr:hypothetical protein DFQ26_002008 [Actinomortierella ambigua]